MLESLFNKVPGPKGVKFYSEGADTKKKMGPFEREFQGPGTLTLSVVIVEYIYFAYNDSLTNFLLLLLYVKRKEWNI